MLSKYSSPLIFSLTPVYGELIVLYSSFKCGSMAGDSIFARTCSGVHGANGSGCAFGSNIGDEKWSVLFFSISLFPMMGLTAVSELCINS